MKGIHEFVAQWMLCKTDDVSVALEESPEAHYNVLQYCVYSLGSFSTEDLQVLLPSLQQLYDYIV